MTRAARAVLVAVVVFVAALIGHRSWRESFQRALAELDVDLHR